MFQPTPAAAVLRIYILIIALFYFFCHCCLLFLYKLFTFPPTSNERALTVSLQRLRCVAAAVFPFAPWEIMLLAVSHNYAQRTTGVWARALFR